MNNNNTLKLGLSLNYFRFDYKTTPKKGYDLRLNNCNTFRLKREEDKAEIYSMPNRRSFISSDDELHNSFFQIFAFEDGL